jgi:hypothetical protein
LYDFQARNDEELNLKRGEYIYVLEENDNGWWLGKLEDDKEGNAISKQFSGENVIL